MKKTGTIRGETMTPKTDNDKLSEKVTDMAMRYHEQIATLKAENERLKAKLIEAEGYGNKQWEECKRIQEVSTSHFLTAELRLKEYRELRDKLTTIRSKVEWLRDMKSNYIRSLAMKRINLRAFDELFDNAISEFSKVLEDGGEEPEKASADAVPKTLGEMWINEVRCKRGLEKDEAEGEV